MSIVSQRVGRITRTVCLQVTIGKNLTFFVGYLKYEETELALPLEYIILISVGGGVLILSVIVVIIMYRMKSKKNNSMMRRMQIQMDNLESKVAKECKEGRERQGE